MNDIGQLPNLTPEQLEQLHLKTKDHESEVYFRLIRDPLLRDIDPTAYKYSQESADLYFTDKQYKWYLYLINNMSNSYIARLLYTTDLYNDALDTKNPELITDLISPERIPNDYNADTRSRIRNIASALYQMKGHNWQYEYLLHLQRLSTPKSSTAIYTAKYMGKYPLLVKGLSPSSITAADLVYEYLVGLVVNTLRSDIPNFMYTYGLTKGANIEEVLENGAAFYAREDPYLCTLLLEYLQDSISLRDITEDTCIRVILNSVLHNCTSTDMIRVILLQILCAIAYAYHKIGFIHRDPHCGNILLVSLGRVMAVPIMIPVSYTPSDGRAKVEFVRRFILTDTLVMFIDYGLSTVDATYLNSHGYNNRQFISPDSIYHMYETRSEFENDIVIMLLSILCNIKSAYYDTDKDSLLDMYKDVMSILYRLYTGETLDSNLIKMNTFSKYYKIINKDKFNYYTTHPSIKYDHYGAIIEFCNKYSQLYTVTEYDTTLYQNVLDISTDLDITRTVSDTMQYSLYKMYTNILADYEVDTESITENVWYRSVVLNRIMQGNYTYTNRGIIQCIYEYTDDVEQGTIIIISVFRYMYKYSNLSLNMLPFRYSDPVDILRDMLHLFEYEASKYWDPLSDTVKEYITQELEYIMQ